MYLKKVRGGLEPPTSRLTAFFAFIYLFSNSRVLGTYKIFAHPSMVGGVSNCLRILPQRVDPESECDEDLFPSGVAVEGSNT